MINKKAQNEIIGFVIIVLIVTVVSVIFLGLSLRNDQVEVPDDAEIAKFLSASQRYTTQCAKDFLEDYQDMEETINLCYSNINFKCKNDKKACEVVEEDFTEIMNMLWPVGPNRPLKYHKLDIFYQGDLQDESSIGTHIMELEQGNQSYCPIKTQGETIQSTGSGYIVSQLTVCKGVE